MHKPDLESSAGKVHPTRDRRVLPPAKDLARKHPDQRDRHENADTSNRARTFGLNDQGTDKAHAFLLLTGQLLHQYGTPSYRWEGVLQKVAAAMDVPGTFLYTPTAIHVSLGHDDAACTYLRRIEPGDVDIAKLLSFDRTLESFEAGEIDIDEATTQLRNAADAPSRFPAVITMLAAAVACAGVAIIFGGSLNDMSLAGMLGLLIAAIGYLMDRGGAQTAWKEPIFGFVVATVAVLAARVIPCDDRLITLAALILPLPGLSMTVALTELALGHLNAGSARMAGASVRLFALVLGVAIAWRLLAPWHAQVAPVADTLPMWMRLMAFGISPFAFAIVFRAPISQWPVIFAVSAAGILASQLGKPLEAAEIGAFGGALVVGVGSNLYARLRNRPAMVPQTPGLLILVPGSIGYRSLTALLNEDVIQGVDLAFNMLLIGTSLVGGLLLANLLLSPKRVL